MDPEPLPVPFDIATVLWRPQCPFSSAVLSKGSIDATLYLKSELEWVNRIHTERYGWIVGCEIILSSGERFRVVAVHSLAFPMPRDRWADADVPSIKLTNNPELWFTEILWALLCTASISDGTNWIVGGDFNSSVKFDKPKDRGNQEIIDRGRVNRCVNVSGGCFALMS